MMDYSGKMVSCAGLEMMVRYAVWQVGAGAVWWFGLRWFNWQSL